MPEMMTSAEYRSKYCKGKGKPKDKLTNAEGRELLKKQPNRKKNGNGDKAKWEMKMVLQLLDVEFVTEYRFHKKRRFRFDFAIPNLKIGIEYEGLMSEKSGHTTVTGYTKDTEKYNLAQSEGWTVLRYTILNYTNLTDELKQLLTKKPNHETGTI